VAILAGGRSRRMGTEKALLALGAATLVERVLAAAAPLGVPCMLIGGQPRAFAGLGLPVHPDLRPGLGPLGGLHTALALAPAARVLFLACDLPFMTTAFLRFVLDQLGEHQAAVPRSADGLQPLCAAYARSCLPAVERALDRGDLRMTAFHADVDVHILEPSTWQAHDRCQLLFTNINTPQEYQWALARLKER
jgi:molybdopterin-guanine dinucleotide biosynthesis protein A